MRHLIYRSSSWFSLLLAVAAVVALLAQPASATLAQSNGIFIVNVPTDLPDSNLADNICDADPGLAVKCTLRAAIMQANAMPGEQTIQVVLLDYRLTIQGAGEDAARTGDLDITDDLLMSIGQNDTPFTIDASGLGDRALDIFGAISKPVKVKLYTMVVTGGRADRFGGGIRVGKNVDLTLYQSEIKGNSAGEAGGAIYSDGHLNLEYTRVENNRTLTPTAVSGGGGIYAVWALLKHSVIRANVSQSKGGGLLIQGGRMFMEQSAIIGNSAVSDGGGVFFYGTDFDMFESTVSGNRALLDVAQQIYSRGGGLHIARAYFFRIRHSTIVQNHGFGGGLSADDVVEGRITGAILANNMAANCLFTNSSFPLNATNNLASDRTCRMKDQYNMFDRDPLLGPLSEAKSFTPFHLPLPGSPVIDAFPVSGDAFCLGAADQRGLPRPVDGNGDGVARCELGAIERQSDDPTTTPTPLPPTPTATPKPNATPTPTPIPPIPPVPTALTE